MPQARAAPIAPVEYVNPDHPELGIETFRLTELWRRAPAGSLEAPQRPRFHMLMHVTAGRGAHDIDFHRHALRPGTVVHLRPGQVQRFHPAKGLEAQLVLFTPEFLPSPAAGEPADAIQSLLEDVVPAARLEIGRGAPRALAEGFADLAQEYAAYDGTGIARRILQHSLQALLLRLSRVCSGLGAAATSDASRRTYRRFARELERRFGEWRRVEDYAGALGYSARTLTRASLEAAGVPAKELIERRVAMEAKRLLAHTSRPVGTIALDLGFSEPTNFVKFFRRREGVAPLAFRRRLGGR